MFFCGAGVSYPAGLPGFKGLVSDIYRHVGTDFLPQELITFQKGQYDSTLDLLEHRLPGGRLEIRQALKHVLKPKRRKRALDTHCSLLLLATTRNRKLRLITTNFDTLFDRAARKLGRQFPSHIAPMLPVPKASRWDGLIYLHGHIPSRSNDNDLNSLVLTSGDFGLAYLTERWAARFASELFRNYVVCFVGYSINDPVLKYMMDALAADRKLGESIPKAYAFGDFSPSTRDKKYAEWEAKGVTPILYENPEGDSEHRALHDTLRSWSEVYRDGVIGKEQIIVNYATSVPSASSHEDDFVGRVLWALSDDSGMPAKRFADHIPTPKFDWIKAFTDPRYSDEDLPRFGITAYNNTTSTPSFSLIHRPAPHTLSPWMSLLFTSNSEGNWDKPLYHLARWLLCHLNDPSFILWIVSGGLRLHGNLLQLVDEQIRKIRKLKAPEIEQLISTSPNAVPDSYMESLWELIISGRIQSNSSRMNFSQWLERFEHSGLTPALRFDLRAIFSPKVVLREKLQWPFESDHLAQGSPSRTITGDVVLSDNYVRSALLTTASVKFSKELPNLFLEFQSLLLDAMDLHSVLNKANHNYDQSHWDLRSIEPHYQNRGSKDWTLLIELTRDAWLKVLEEDAEKARQLALGWFDFPYPVFKRLALYAASIHKGISQNDWLNWLTVESSWWLWAAETKREVMRLLVQKGSTLSGPSQAALEAAILAGPPRSMYVADIDNDVWNKTVDQSVWLRLSKLQQGTCQLSEKSILILGRISHSNPTWSISPNDREEFSSWSSSNADADFDDIYQVDYAPRKRKDLVHWLTIPVSEEVFHTDTWRQTCRERFFHSLLALHDLSNMEQWPVQRWREALQTWSEDALITRSAKCLPPILTSMPSRPFTSLQRTISWWVKEASNTEHVDIHLETLISLCGRALEITHEKEEAAATTHQEEHQPVLSAINHTIGFTSQALIKLWLSQKPRDNDGIASEFKTLFLKLCDRNNIFYIHGRVILLSHLITFYRVDEKWTRENLLPLLRWKGNRTEATAAWAGFLWSPRLYPPLMSIIKKDFLETSKHYDILGDHQEHYAVLFTNFALDCFEASDHKDLQKALARLPKEGLSIVARALWQALEGAGHQKEYFWNNRIKPFWLNVWPKDNSFMSNAIAINLAHLCLSSGREFPAASQLVRHWLSANDDPSFLIHLLRQTDFPSQFPSSTLEYLHAVTGERNSPKYDLNDILEIVAKSKPDIANSPLYLKLKSKKGNLI